MNMNKLLILLVFSLLGGCATIDSNKDKINTIANEEVKKEYILPLLNQCPNLEKFKGLGFYELYTDYKLLREQYKICNEYNKDKIEWFKRNFPEEVKK